MQRFRYHGGAQSHSDRFVDCASLVEFIFHTACVAGVAAPEVNHVLFSHNSGIRWTPALPEETTHFGRPAPAQPMSVEALACRKSKIEGKRVVCQLLKRDQFDRIVSTSLKFVVAACSTLNHYLGCLPPHCSDIHARHARLASSLLPTSGEGKRRMSGSLRS